VSERAQGGIAGIDRQVRSGGFHTLDRPTPGSMAERQLEAGVSRLDLEERARPGHDRERRALVADADDVQDAKPSTVESDLARPTIEPVGSNPDLDRLDTDHRHFAAPFGGAIASSGHRALVP
jgi:hypothetical protein